MNSASTNEDNIGALNADWANQKEITKVCFDNMICEKFKQIERFLF